MKPEDAQNLIGKFYINSFFEVCKIVGHTYDPENPDLNFMLEVLTLDNVMAGKHLETKYVMFRQESFSALVMSLEEVAFKVANLKAQQERNLTEFLGEQFEMLTPLGCKIEYNSSERNLQGRTLLENNPQKEKIWKELLQAVRRC